MMWKKRSFYEKTDIFVVETDRLLLRVVRQDADKEVADYLIRNRSFHKPFHQYQPDIYFTQQEQRMYILSDLKAFRRGDRCAFWISEKKRPQYVIGRLSFSAIVRGALSSCLVGYHLDKMETGKGYMREALDGGCRYMFRNQELHRIQADVMPHNAPSIRCVESCGFKRQGLNEKYMCIDGKWQDHICFAKINEYFK